MKTSAIFMVAFSLENQNNLLEVFALLGYIAHKF